ncbi:MAG: chaperone modulator CbpM [Opitutaceae bacterium]
MSAFADVPAFSLQRFTPEPDAIYPIDTIAHLAGVPRHTVLLCCRHHLISPHEDPEYGGYQFDVGTIQTLQRADYLYRECGINFNGVRIILGLMEEVERMRARMREL